MTEIKIKDNQYPPSQKRNIDLVITGSSRPQLFPFCWESFKKYVHFRGNLRVIFNEDFVFPKESHKMIKYLEGLRDKGEIHEIIIHNPAIGLGNSLDHLIKHEIKSDFIFYLQDDWEFEVPIDLDRLLWIMERNPKINLIFLNKSKNWPKLSETLYPQYTFDFVDFTLFHGWSFLPGIWRMKKVREKWKVRDIRPEGFFTNQFGNHEQRLDIKYCKENLGAYALGKNGEDRYIRHIGYDWRMANWRLQDGGKVPGGTYDKELMDYRFRPAWLPKLIDTPHRKVVYEKEDIKQMLSEEIGM